MIVSSQFAQFQKMAKFRQSYRFKQLIALLSKSGKTGLLNLIDNLQTLYNSEIDIHVEKLNI